MGVRADIREEVRKETVTKIHGQPTNQDLTILKKELIAILANIPTTLGGGNHGHAGILMDPARYLIVMVELHLPSQPIQETTQQMSQGTRQRESRQEQKLSTKRK